jgi:hypothetical protein
VFTSIAGQWQVLLLSHGSEQVRLFANGRLCTAAKSSMFNKIATQIMTLTEMEEGSYLFHRPVNICQDRRWQWIGRVILSDFSRFVTV